jgi:hypothetical protein
MYQSDTIILAVSEKKGKKKGNFKKERKQDDRK